MELKSKLIGLLGIVIIGVVFLNLGGITGNVVDDPCEYYYQKWGPESWFNTWDWYNENCEDMSLEILSAVMMFWKQVKIVIQMSL